VSEALTGINGQIIKWAREYYNMTSDEAAKAIGVDINKYCNWESGQEFPTYAKLKKVSEVFHKPSAIFFFPNPPHIPTIKGDLRTLSSEVINGFSKNIILQFEKAKVYQLSLHELYGDKPSIISKRSEFPKGIDELCKYLRQMLALPISVQKQRKSPKVVFEIFRERLYELGIYVFKDSFKDNRVSGLCVNDEHFPIIMINNSM
jgi:transcriptional regulator with XRE-family HTH domain